MRHCDDDYGKTITESRPKELECNYYILEAAGHNLQMDQPFALASTIINDLLGHDEPVFIKEKSINWWAVQETPIEALVTDADLKMDQDKIIEQKGENGIDFLQQQVINAEILETIQETKAESEQ